MANSTPRKKRKTRLEESEYWKRERFKKEMATNPWDFYQQKGLSIFPVKADKKPVVKWKGFQTCHASPDEITEWKKSRHNVAIATGMLSDLMVVDADSAEAVAELERLNSDGIKVPTAHSPRSGRKHFYVRYRITLMKNLQGCGKSRRIDLKTDGGYVLAPPGETKDGKYEWDEKLNLDTVPIPVIPKRWEYLLLHARLLTELRRTDIPPGPRLVEGRRDNDIFRMACVFRREGYSRKFVEKRAVEMARECNPPFPEQEAMKKVESAWSRQQTASDQQREFDDSIPMTIMASDVQPTRVSWLWPNHIPLRRLTSLSGDPGTGKSWFALDLACRLSRGLPWADGSPGIGPAKTYYMSVEDDKSDTIRPRIDSLGGDPSMIALYNSECPLHINLSTPGGLERLECEVRAVGSVRLIVGDPVLDFTGSKNPSAVEVVREMLTPLQKMGDRLNCAILLVGHLSKAQTQKAVYKILGSASGWVGKCRSVFAISIEDSSGGAPIVRRFSTLKANLSFPHPEQLTFEIIDGRLQFDTNAEQVDLEEALNPQQGRPPVRRTHAIECLERLFENREEIPASEIQEMAEGEGLTMRTLHIARAVLGYTTERRVEGDVDMWIWKKRG